MAPKLFEGFVGKVGSAVRDFFSREPERKAAEMQKGLGTPYLGWGTSGVYGGVGGSWGKTPYIDYLQLEQDLIRRYIEYEEMDEAPEISCFCSDVSVALPRESANFNSMAISDIGYQTIGQLAKDYEDGKHGQLLVYAFDQEAGRVVVAEARGPVCVGRRQVYKVTYEEYRGREGRTWSVKATGDHLFMRRDGSYCAVMDLEPGDRLMPCTLSIGSNGYLCVYEPMLKDSGWTNVHRLVAECVSGVPLADLVVHHIDGDRSNPSPSNLEIMQRGDHVRIHLADLVAEDQRRRAIAKTVGEQWKDSEYKLKLVNSHVRGDDGWLKKEKAGEHQRKPKAGVLSEAHCRAISEGRTIPLAPDVVEAALRSSASVNDAAKKLGVSWMTLRRRMDRYGLGWEILGTNLRGPQLGEGSYLNHRVVSIEKLGFEDVYDLEVPKYHNFAVGEGGGGFVFVHNCALDIYADDATVPRSDGETTIWGYSNDVNLKEDIDDELFKVGAHNDLWPMVRTLCKYGDVYSEIVLGRDPKEGVIGLNFLPPPTVRRIEHPKMGLIGFMQNPTGMFPTDLASFWNYWMQTQDSEKGQNMKAYQEYALQMGKYSSSVMFEDWQVVHWRLRGKHLRSIYGYPVIEAARWPWRRLALMEDSLIFYKLERTPARHAFYIDIGTDDAKRGAKKLEDARRDLSRKRYVNKQGQLDTRFSVLAPDEDFFIPVRDGKRLTDVELIQGADFSETDSLDYFRRKLVGALKVPLSRMGGGDEESSRNMLSSVDIGFARTVMRVQQTVRMGWHQVMYVHFVTQGRAVDKRDYDIRMTVPSQIMDLARSEVMSAKADLAGRLQEIVGTKWVLVNVLGMSEEEAVDVMDDKKSEMVRQAKIDADAEAIRNPQPAEQVEEAMRLLRAGLKDQAMVALTRPQPRQTFANRGDWKRDFESKGGKSAEMAADRKLNKLLSENAGIRQRLHMLGGLLQDIRAANRPVHFEQRSL